MKNNLTNLMGNMKQWQVAAGIGALTTVVASGYFYLRGKKQNEQLQQFVNNMNDLAEKSMDEIEPEVVVEEVLENLE